MRSEEPIPTSFLLERDTPGRQRFGFGYGQPVLRASVFRDLVGSYDQTLICAEDTLALQQLLCRGARIGVIDVAKYVYHIDPTSSSNRPGVNIHISRANRVIMRVARLHSPELIPLVRSRQTAIDYDALKKAVSIRRWKEAMYFAKSLSLAGLAKQAWRLSLKRVGVRSRMVNPLTGKPD